MQRWDAELAQAADQAVAVGNNYSHFEVCFQGFHKDLYAAELVTPPRRCDLPVIEHRGIARCEPFDNTPAFARPLLVWCSRSRSPRRRACTN